MKSIAARYALAVGSVAVAFLLQPPLSTHLGQDLPYVTFYPAVMFIAMVAGFGPGVLATTLSALAVAGSILWPLDVPQWIGMGLFSTTGLFVSSVAGLYHRAHRRADAFEDELALRESLRESEEQFRAFFDNAAVGAVQLDLTGRFVHVNDCYCQITGYSREELLRMSPWDITHPDDRQGDWDQYLRFRNMEVPVYDVEKRYVRKDGAMIWVHVSGGLVRDAKGRPMRTAGVIRDVTWRKQAEEALAEKARLLELTFDSILVRDLSDRITFWNRGAEIRYGWSSQEALGQAVHRLLKTRSPEPLDEIAKKLDRDGQWEGELTHTTRHGDEIVVASRWALLRDSGGVPTAVLETNNDITERKRREQELVAARSQAEAASRAKSEFLANMSHEIRTPMTAILGFADLLMDADTSDDERLEYAQTVRRNGQNLLQLINDMLDLSKIEAGRLEAEPMTCSPRQIVEDVLALLQIRAGEKKLTLVTDYRYPLPATVRTDPIRLRQILMNLVGNAVKFTEAGSVRVCVTLVTGPVARLLFAVQDTGIGIGAEGLAELFQPFSQVDRSTTRRHGGTGLGLAISQRLAALLGGRIAVTSQPGKGSTFSVEIDPGPLEGVAMISEPATALESAAERNARHPALQGRVLVVEDSADNQNLTRLILERGGLTVGLAPGGESALSMVTTALAEGRPYDLILVDVQMPDMDGHMVTRQLRRGGFRQPIVALTACAMPDDREQCLKAGCDDYLSKPVSGEALLAAVAHHLGQA